MIDLRALLDRNRIPWRDRGSNTSVGNINVCCPFCGTDPSYHLSISEEGNGYFCWRNSRHAGRNLLTLLRALKIPIEGINPKDVGRIEEDLRPTVVKDYSLFRHFQPAQASVQAVAYLHSRGFSMPAEVCKKFDLRVDLQGVWSQRLIIPLTAGWTGRAMRYGVEPRYKSETDETGFFYYCWDKQPRSLLIFEGPLDAIRAASLSHQFAVTATLGKRMSPSFLLAIQAKQFQDIYIVPDNDVPAHEFFYFARYLASFCARSSVKLLAVPAHVKDLCELQEEEVLRWLNSIGGQFSNRGLDLGLSGPATTVDVKGGR